MKVRNLITASMAAFLLLSPNSAVAAEPALSSSQPVAAIPYGWTKVDGHPDGTPKKECGPSNDGEMVETEDAEGGRRFWSCRHINPIFKDPYWEWSETVLQ
ncbi:hypothetical protein ACL1E1_12415 [Corynebacterium striatum]